jgi:hypothetical protein
MRERIAALGGTLSLTSAQHAQGEPSRSPGSPVNGGAQVVASIPRRSAGAPSAPQPAAAAQPAGARNRNGT